MAMRLSFSPSHCLSLSITRPQRVLCTLRLTALSSAMSLPGRKRQASGSVPLVDPEQLRQAKKQRVPSTCEWIRHEQSYQSWRSWDETLPSTLWIHGPAGAGKSFLAHFIADELRATGDKSVVVSCYCHATSTPASMLRTVFSQLLARGSPNEDLRGRLSAAIHLTNEASPSSAPPTDTSYKLWDRFVEIIEAAPPITLIVDGLDELPTKYLARHEFNIAGRLAELTGIPAGCVRLLVLSRPASEIRKALSGSLEVNISQQKTRDDLEKFVDFNISQSSGLAPLPDSVRAQLATELARRAEGIFTWASLSLEALAKEPLTDSSRLLEHLDGLPSALDDIYAELLAKQAKTLTSSELALRDAVLRWTCVAVRPLRTVETANAIAFETLQFFSDLEGGISDVCNSLIKIEDGLVLPMHHSFREFFCSTRAGGGGSNLSRFHLATAKALLFYLSHPALSDLKELADDDKFEQSHPLLEYASLYWVHHCSQSPPDADLQAQILSFFRTKNASIWLDILLPRMLRRSVLPVPPRPPMNARFCHLISLKSQICNYFGPEKKKSVDADLAGWLRSTYEGFLVEATTSDGDHSVHRLRRLLELGELYSWLPGCQDEAVGILEESLQLANELPTPETLELKLTAYQALADEYKRRAKYDQAIALLEALVAFATADRKFFALDSLGWVSSRLGRLETARAYLEEALEIARIEHGSNSPLTLRSKVTLAEVLSKLGRHEEAEELCAALEAQVNSHRQHGVPLPKDSISQLNTLASVYGQRGKYAEAVELYKLIVKDRKEAFGASHRLSLWAEMQLGLMMHKSGDVESATELLLDLQPRQLEVLGPEHPDVRQVGALVQQQQQ